MDGKTIYHAGDTGLFGDMELIGRLNHIDVALLPIGDNFTMGPEDALEAVKMLKPGLVIPMHYNTFPVIRQDPELFREQVESATPARVKVLSPGESAAI
jgi:L-ascorbate metabolism protein UlaG (beta-lactamase superfamily)